MKFPLASIVCWYCLSGTAAFTPQKSPAPKTNDWSSFSGAVLKKQIASAVLTAAFLGGNILTSAPALAFFEEQQQYTATIGGEEAQTLLAARSGGRTGGRVSRSSSMPRSSYARPSTTINRQTTIYRTSPTIITPGFGYGYGGGFYSPYGFGPSPGLGLYMGLETIGAVSRAMREARQEQQLARTEEELRQAKMKEMELEIRMAQLEGNQLTQQQQMYLQMMQQMKAQQENGQQTLQPAQ